MHVLITNLKQFARIVGWNDFILTDQFQEGLVNKLRDELMIQGTPDNLEELVQHGVLIGSYLEELRSRRNSQETSLPPVIFLPICLGLLRIQYWRSSELGQSRKLCSRRETEKKSQIMPLQELSDI